MKVLSLGYPFAFFYESEIARRYPVAFFYESEIARRYPVAFFYLIGISEADRLQGTWISNSDSGGRVLQTQTPRTTNKEANATFKSSSETMLLLQVAAVENGDGDDGNPKRPKVTQHTRNIMWVVVEVVEE